MKENSAIRRDASSILALEQQVLGILCAADLAADERSRALDLLATYAWRAPEHATVFHAIRRIGGVRQPFWRDELPAETTRMGFPEVDWFRYFGAAKKASPALKILIARLMESVTPQKDGKNRKRS